VFIVIFTHLLLNSCRYTHELIGLLLAFQLLANFPKPAAEWIDTLPFHDKQSPAVQLVLADIAKAFAEQGYANVNKLVGGRDLPFIQVLHATLHHCTLYTVHRTMHHTPCTMHPKPSSSSSSSASAAAAAPPPPAAEPEAEEEEEEG
jgi:hypothetical protein